MTNKIIEAARLAGATRAYPEAQSTRDDAYLVGRQFLARFYALARADALEDAAKVCDEEHKRARYNMDVDLSGNQQFWNGAAIFADQLGEAIRALKDHDAAIAAGKGEG